MNSADFLKGAPEFITKRFNSINTYVWQTLLSEKTVKEVLARKKTQKEKRRELARIKSISDEASALVMLFLLNKFFTEGSNAAKQAVDIFKQLDVEGFYIGQNYFSGRNDKVVQGDIISRELLASIKDEKALALIKKSTYMSEILDEYRKFILNG